MVYKTKIGIQKEYSKIKTLARVLKILVLKLRKKMECFEKIIWSEETWKVLKSKNTRKYSRQVKNEKSELKWVKVMKWLENDKRNHLE